MRGIEISQTEQSPVGEQPVEIVERKGLGHPDTICDLLVELISTRLSQACLQQFGRVLHYNLDKALLVAGTSEPEFGGGRITSPMRIVLGDRATTSYGDQKIALDSIIDDSVKHWFEENLVHIDSSKHLIVQNEIQPGSAELTGIFQRDRVVANDTSAAVGYAPLSETERIVLATGHWLNSRETRQRLPTIGADIKLMAVRNGRRLGLTTAIAFVDQHVSSAAQYFEQKEVITVEIQRFLENQIQTINEVDVHLNTLDDPLRGKAGMYLTVSGTSAECGDSGQVGRGNNVRGLISLNRPVANEAAAGKNPVSHVGKIYNLLSYRIADRIHESVQAVDEVYVWLVSQIGRPIDEPWLASASLKLKPGTVKSDVEDEVRVVIDKELANISAFCEQLMSGVLMVC